MTPLSGVQERAVVDLSRRTRRSWLPYGRNRTENELDVMDELAELWRIDVSSVLSCLNASSGML